MRHDDAAFATDEAWGHAIVVLAFAVLLLPAGGDQPTDLLIAAVAA